MSKKKKEKAEEPKKGKAAKPKKNIIPASLPVLVQATAPAPAPEPLPAAAPKAKKAPAKKKPAKGKKPVTATIEIEEITISNDDIALRAYFIAEKRRSHGHWGDETGDWVEAERQLRAEAARKK